jgi:hypothetical protein
MRHANRHIHPHDLNDRAHSDSPSIAAFDGIFVPRAWLPRLKSCRVVHGSRWSQLSDHNPVVADFDDDAEPSRPVCYALPRNAHH